MTIPVATVTVRLERSSSRSNPLTRLPPPCEATPMYWLWDAHTVSVIVPIGFERRKPSGFLWGAYLDTGAMIKINDKNNRTSKTDFIMQMAAMMGYQATDWLRVGSRFQLGADPEVQAEQHAARGRALPPLRQRQRASARFYSTSTSTTPTASRSTRARSGACESLAARPSDARDATAGR